MSIIGDTLRAVGIGANYQGYRYLGFAIELALEGGAGRVCVTKELYPAIARRFNTSWWCVEKDIRTAISRAWESRGQNRFKALTGYCSEAKPTNGQFICLMAEALRDIAMDSQVGDLWLKFLVEA